MISYDVVWETFLNNYKAEDIDLPRTDAQRYKFITNAVLLLNNRLRLQAVCNDLQEQIIDIDNNEDMILLIAHYIKLTFLKNDLVYFEKLWQPLSSDVGIKNFRVQLSSLSDSIKEQEKLIERFIFNSMEDYL